MSWFLNLLYLLISICGSPWMLWRIIKGKNRSGWNQKLFGLIAPRPFDKSVLANDTGDGSDSDQCIWVHAVSVGEVNLLGPILHHVQERMPGLSIAISTTTETGFDLAQKKYPDHYVFFCPFDFTWAIKNVLRRIRPAALVLAELELWPNLISVTRQSGIPVAVMNARLSEKSARGYQRIGFLLSPIFKKLSLVLCQNETYANRFRELGCPESRIQVTGNVKFDGINTDRDNPATHKLAAICQIEPNEKVFLAGSTQLEEDIMAARVYQRMSQEFPNLRLILIPRHPNRVSSLVVQLEKMAIEYLLRSNMTADADSTRSNSLSSKPILIVDVIGELGSWWGRADIAYVGGSMGSRGGQNMIEPAGYGIPVSFGPNSWNFRETVEQLNAANAATVVNDEQELEKFARWVLLEAGESAAMGTRAQKVVLDHVGASQRTAESLCQLIQTTAGDTDARTRTPKAA